MYVAALDLVQAGHEILPEFRRSLDEPFLDQYFQCLPGHGTGQGISTEGRAVVTWSQQSQHLPIGEHGRDRVHASRKCLAQCHHISADTFVLSSEQPTGSESSWSVHT